MAATDATAFPIYGRAYRIPLSFYDNLGNLLSGWSSPAAQVSIDGAAFINIAAPVEIGGDGVGTLDLTGAQMLGQLCIVRATIANTNAQPFLAGIYPLNVGNRTGGWDQQTTWRFEDIITDIAAVVLNFISQSGSLTVVGNRDGTSRLTGSYTESDSLAQRTTNLQ